MINPITVVRGMNNAGKTALAVVASVCAGEAILGGGMLLRKEIEDAAGYISEVQNPTVYAVREGGRFFGKKKLVRRSFKPYCTDMVEYVGTKKPVNKKPVRVPVGSVVTAKDKK